MRTYAFVFARGGSKGLPRKNVRWLGGKPLVAWSVEVAQQVPAVEAVFVSTEDEEVAEIAAQHGAEVIRRPPELATDTAPEWLAWRHAIREVKQSHGDFDVFVSLPPTSPLRSVDDVVAAVNTLDHRTDVVLTMTESSRNPWFNMVVQAEDGSLRTVLVPDGTIARRQDAPQTYDLTTVAYVLRPDFVVTADRIWDGRVRGLEVSSRSAVDIDSSLDLEYAEFLLQRTQGGR